MNTVVPPTEKPRWRGLGMSLIRLVAGYIVAVAAGAFLFSLITSGALPNYGWNYVNPDISLFETVARQTLMFFILGVMFGLPYTAFGLLAFRYVLPRNMVTFLIVGAICPTIAILLFGWIAGGMFFWDVAVLQIFLLTLLPGAIAAYLFGAIGLGLGFGRWRFA